MVPRLQLPASVQSTEPRQELVEQGRPKSGSGRKACSARDGCLKEAEVSSSSLCPCMCCPCSRAEVLFVCHQEVACRL